MDTNFNVLVVDDSPLELELTISLLKEHFNVTSATNGAEALDVIASREFSLVLLDVNMPGMTGYEVCRKIRERDKLIKIIFVSAYNTTEEILKGHDAGGDDYVVKPWSPEILLLKVSQAIDRRIASRSSEVLAMDAMTNLGELGTVITFLKSSFRATNLDVLAGLIVGFLGRFNLSACFQLRTELSQKNYSTQTNLTAIEEELLKRTAEMNGRIAERDQRIFINYPNASLMIKNMPTKDELAMGRLRDILTFMVEGADEKLSLLAIEEETQIALNFIQSVHQKIEAENSAFVQKTIRQIEFAFARLGMTEDQEDDLIGLITKSQLEFENNFKDTRIIEAQINNILKKIHSKSEALAPSMNSDAIDFF